MPPRIDRSNLKDIVLKAGQNLKLDVKISGEPPPSKTWFLNKARLDSQDNLTIDSEDYKTKLSVVLITRKQTGTYTIKAENASGRDEASVEVTVHGESALSVALTVLKKISYFLDVLPTSRVSKHMHLRPHRFLVERSTVHANFTVSTEYSNCRC